MHGPPPPASLCSPARLWRMFAALGGRPWWPLAARCAAAHDTPLHVVALRGVEVEGLLDAAGTGAARFERFRMAVLAASLHTPEGLAFPSPSAAGDLDAGEADALTDACFAALAVCSPTYQRSAVGQWEAVLLQGARDPSNLHEAVTMGGCVEHGFAGNTPRPDLWFGLPIGALTDGQQMAYRAARAALRSLQTDSAPSKAPPPFR